MNPLKLKKRIFMLVALMVAYSMTRTVAPRLFIADSPQIDTQFVTNLRNIPQDTVAYLRGITGLTQRDELAELEKNKVDEVPAGTQFYPVAKGVQAAEDPATGHSYVRFEAGTKLDVRTVRLSGGREVKVYIPVE